MEHLLQTIIINSMPAREIMWLMDLVPANDAAAYNMSNEELSQQGVAYFEVPLEESRLLSTSKASEDVNEAP